MFKSGIIYNSRNSTTGHILKTTLLLGTGLSILYSGSALAQSDGGSGDEVIVVGTRQTIQDSIEIKRQSTTIVDGLSSQDIGDIPALSIGEALETLTGSASHREQGGATEISIRGLGPFLGSTTFNGREATNGSGDRSVNFSQFPSELIEKLKIYKTQEASLIEGGVSGQIQLETVKPLDYGKRRFQVGVKGNYNPDNSAMNVKERGIGYRLTGSYLDQFETSGGGQFGISLGVQLNRSTNPEQEARTSSGFRDCRNVITGDSDSDNFGVDSLGDPDQNCDSGGGDLDLEVDPATGTAPDANTPFVLVSSQRHFRQNITVDDRDSVFAAIQWQPDNSWDINADFQYSDRTFTERRSDLTIDGNSLLNPGESGEVVPLNVSPTGALRGGTTLDGAEISSQYVERLEEYIGGGIGFDHDVSDRLSFSLDASYSKTERRENIVQTRLRSNTDDDGGAEDVFAGFVVENDHHRFTFREFDVTDPASFIAGPRTREDLNQFRNNEIIAIRSDFDYAWDRGAIKNLRGGLRYSELRFDSVPRVRVETDGSPNDLSSTWEADFPACRNSVFPENNFLSSVADGTLITNLDASGNVIDAGTGASWVSYDPICLANAILGRPFSIPDPDDTISNVDVRENTISGYLQADYETMFGEKPVRGNLGLRVVNTDVTSTGLRGELAATVDAVEGTISIDDDLSNLVMVEGGSSYTEFLPSFNAVVDLQDDILFRAGIFRALSRPDPSDLGFGRNFGGIDPNGATSVSDAVGRATANGNPNLAPLTSWNFDVALEWYPNEDTILAGGVYYKSFLGGFENSTQVEEFNVGGEMLTTNVTTQNVVNDTSTIYGFELTASTAFTQLPGILSGLGAKVSYNWADSNFEFEDAEFGDSIQFSGGQATPRIGIVDPGNLFGFSEHVFSGQLYYQWRDLDLQAIVKHRSEYFQQFVSTPGNLRYVGNNTVFEARASYRINDNIRLTLEGINLFNEPKTQYNPTRDSFAEVNVYGPRLYAGIVGKF